MKIAAPNLIPVLPPNVPATRGHDESFASLNSLEHKSAGDKFEKKAEKYLVHK